VFIKDIIAEANNLADDFLTNEEVMGFVNDAISTINIETKANFPLARLFHEQIPRNHIQSQLSILLNRFYCLLI